MSMTLSDQIPTGEGRKKVTTRAITEPRMMLQRRKRAAIASSRNVNLASSE